MPATWFIHVHFSPVPTREVGDVVVAVDVSHGPDASLHQVVPQVPADRNLAAAAVFAAAVMDVVHRAASASGVSVRDEEQVRTELMSAYMSSPRAS